MRHLFIKVGKGDTYNLACMDPGLFELLHQAKKVALMHPRNIINHRNGKDMNSHVNEVEDWQNTV